MIAWTDGSAHPNPGPGGFGVVITDENNNVLETYSKQYKNTTNNEMELKAILYAFCRAILKGEEAIIYSDSSYAINVYTNWSFTWAKNNWMKSDNNIPKNLEIVKSFHLLAQKYKFELRKVKGHVGIEMNELADKLAKGELV